MIQSQNGLDHMTVPGQTKIRMTLLYRMIQYNVSYHWICFCVLSNTVLIYWDADSCDTGMHMHKYVIFFYDTGMQTCMILALNNTGCMINIIGMHKFVIFFYAL